MPAAPRLIACTYSLSTPASSRKFGADVGHILGVVHRFDRRLAYRPTLVLPELLGELGAADADELHALEIGRLGQQDVGEMIGFIVGIGEGDDEGELRQAIGHLRRVP